MVVNRVFLWTSPRSLSTAFERSIRTLSNVKVFHEPFTLPFYCGPERQTKSKIYYDLPFDANETYRNVQTLLCQEYDEVDAVFVKDMAYAVKNKFDLFLDEEFQGFKHTFLIRDPAQCIPSLYKGCMNPMITNRNIFDPEMIGYRELYDFYQFVTRHLDPNPVVVDADDLLDHPDETMKRYCNAVGIKFEPHMTSWEPGPWPAPNNGFCGPWHANLEKCSGFRPRSKQEKNTASKETFPGEVTNAIKECTPYYEFLQMKKMHKIETD